MASFYTLGSQQFPSLDSAEIAAYEATNPLPGTVIHNAETGALMEFNDTAIAFMPITAEAKNTYTKYVRSHTGATYTDTDLIDATIQLFLLDGLPRYEVPSSPNAGSEFSFNDTTGSLSIGTNFDQNDLVIMYKSLTAPIT